MNSRFAVAVHVLTLLARRPGEYLTSESLAGSVNTNPVVVRRVLGTLHRAGLVCSRLGPGGGAALAREPGCVSLHEVYVAVRDEPILALPDRPPNPDCSVGRHVQAELELVFSRAEAALCGELGRTTLAEMAQRVIALNLIEAG